MKNARKILECAALRHLLFIPLLLIAGCATYYQKNIVFQQYFSNGQLEEANKYLEKNKDLTKSNHQLLYNLQKGVVLQMLGDYQTSNNHLEDAYIFTQDYRKNYSLEALSLLTNSSVKPYIGEDHEIVLLHFFKSINFLKLYELDNALVECRLINIKLNDINDKYENRKNRYKVDPFAHNLMGIVFDAAGEFNDAFIAYRNAFNAYKETRDFMGISPPNQLKKDLLRTAYINGFTNELNTYEKQFGIQYEHKESHQAELVFFWHNGLGPVKSEWSTNFFLIKGEGGMVVFENKELGISFPFAVPRDSDGNSRLGDLKIVRAAFPKYIDRKPYYHKGELLNDKVTYPLEKGENISAIAFTTLEDRMLREFATTLIRVALKQATELAARNEGEGLGALISVVNAITEKADTRNWQTLPHDIYYARVPLKEGTNKLKLAAYSHSKDKNEHEFTFEVSKGETIFHTFSNLESAAPASTY